MLLVGEGVQPFGQADVVGGAKRRAAVSMRAPWPRCAVLCNDMRGPVEQRESRKPGARGNRGAALVECIGQIGDCRTAVENGYGGPIMNDTPRSE